MSGAIGGKVILSGVDGDTYPASCRVGAVNPTVAAPRVRLKLKHVRLTLPAIFLGCSAR